MGKIGSRISGLLAAFGFFPGQTVRACRRLPAFFREFRALKRQMAAAESPEFPFGALSPCFHDRLADSGVATGPYFHQDLLVARRICLNQPKVHLDVGSRVDGFVAHVASFRQIQVLDIRPLAATIPNIRFRQADLMAPLGREWADCCDSLSCLHALEHFGLGRYGDPLNYAGYRLGLNNLRSLLQKGGTFYFSVPIGPQRIDFNAHRVFCVRNLLEYFAAHYRIDRFSFVDDRGDLHENVPITDRGAEDNFGCQFGCGIFEMTKR